MTDSSLRWGILGTGGIAALQTSDLVQHGFTVAAVGSRSDAGAKAFAEKWNIPTAHGSYEDLVADPGVEVIYVSTPHPFHYENTLLALNAGKHVLVEKPFALNAAHTREMVELAESKGLVLLEAMWTRYLPHMIRVRELLAEGALGELRTLLVDHSQNLPKDPAHRINDPALGGGALLDLGIYPVSFAYDVFGTPPTKIHASATMTATGVDAQTAMIFDYEGNQRAVMITALDARGPNTACITGTDGRIEIESVWYNPASFTRFDVAGAVVERFELAVEGRGMQYQAWEIERLVAAGVTGNDILSPLESVQIMESLDEVRAIIGLKYPAVDAV